MIGRLPALFLLPTLSLTVSTETPRLLPLAVIKRGHDFTLICSSPQKFQLFYLYKMKFGYMVQTVATATFEKTSLQGQFNNSRFKFVKDDTRYHLTIRNVNKEDDAAYFCHAGSAYDLAFINGTLLVVNDERNEQNSVYVKQIPEVESVRTGESMTLQCSRLSKNKEKAGRCSDEPRVHWFKAASGESKPGLIYSYGNTRAQCGQTSCVYNLSKTMKDSSDTGMYYCAVVTCGEILFGQGTNVTLVKTQVQTGQELNPAVLVLGMLFGCTVIMIVALILFRIWKTVCNTSRGTTSASYHNGPDWSAENQTSNMDGEEGGLNYVALNFPSRKTRRM